MLRRGFFFARGEGKTMSQIPQGRKNVHMGISIPPDVLEDIEKLVRIKSEEHGERYTISAIGCKVMTRWVEKQRAKYGDMLRDY